MKKILLIRLFGVGLLAAIVLSVLSMLFMNQISEMGAAEHRRNFMLSLASSVESNPIDFESLSFFRRPSPAPGKQLPQNKIEDSPRSQAPALVGRPPTGRPSLWVVSPEGKVISFTNTAALPLAWSEMPKPARPHEFAIKEDFLKIAPGTFVLKLADSGGSFLILQEERRHLSGPFFMTQMILLVATISIAVFLALSLTFLYLQKKSKEAKKVLYRLEKGDLKARFEIKAFDEFANLLVDFNRMAEQIEKLVGRVHDTEKTRTNLLQELGHDLRTPLTGLNTSFETLKYHWRKISDFQREELFEIMGGEIEYLSDLLEKLMTFSNLDEPHYRADIDRVDLKELVTQEVKARQAKRDPSKDLEWRAEVAEVAEPVQFVGDPHLILRLLRNALDNAAKYAETKVVVSLRENENEYVLKVEDDGTGFSESALHSFGHRLEHRVRKDRGDKNFSLGLGSVIMKTIADLHGGQVQIRNTTRGAAVETILPKSSGSPKEDRL